MGGPHLQGDMQAFLRLLRNKVEAEEAAAAVGATAGSSSTHEDPTELLQLPSLQLLERSVTYSNGDTYTGSMLGDQRHGQGTHSTSTGDVYEGSWSYDLRSGTGKFTLKTGMCYEGDWEDDKAHGSGKCTYPDGSVYDGEWRADERWGWGSLVTADSQSYEGEWQHNKPHGRGRWVFTDALSFFEGSYESGMRVEGQLVVFDAATKKPDHSYTGSFKNNLRHGQGVGVKEGIWVYRGSWRKDCRWGQGSCSYADGSVYEGEWRQDERCGRGCLRLSSGYEYEGEWQHDQQHGIGKAKYANGERYVGQWQHGKRHGQGKWQGVASAATGSAAGAAGIVSGDAGRETYVGQWAADCREGQGVAVYADGGRYQGAWRANKHHGEGIMLFADGVVFRGLWEEDEWVQSAAEPSLCRLKGPGLSRAVAGQQAVFTIKARDEHNNPRLNGGDTFSVLLIQGRPATAAAEAPVQAAAAAEPLGPTAAAPASTTVQQQLQWKTRAAQLQWQQDQEDEQSEEQQEFPAGPNVVTAVAVGDVQDNGDGSYSCSYSHSLAGVYELHITNGEGEHVADSPYPIRILPGPPSARHSTVSGPGKHTAVAGCLATFEVTARDSNGSGCLLMPGAAGAAGTAGGAAKGQLTSHQLVQQLPLQAQLLGTNTLPVAAAEVTVLPDGRYSCSYTAPAAAGLYVLEVTSGGKHLHGSPFSVKVQEPEQLAENEATSAAAFSALVPSSTPRHCQQQQQHQGCFAAAAAAVPDKVAWWGQVAREAYAAVDGSLEGYEEPQASGSGCQDPQDPVSGLAGPEAEMVKANPELPVVERLEDLWLLSKLQQERKLKQQQQGQHLQGETIKSQQTSGNLRQSTLNTAPKHRTPCSSSSPPSSTGRVAYHSPTTVKKHACSRSLKANQLGDHQHLDWVQPLHSR